MLNEGMATIKQTPSRAKPGIDAESLIILAKISRKSTWIVSTPPPPSSATTSTRLAAPPSSQSRHSNLGIRASLAAQARRERSPWSSLYASGATTFYRLQRRIDSLERSYQRALRELQVIEEVGRAFSLQPSFCSASNQDASSAIGFVPHKSAQPSAEPRTRLRD
jgi:hypothetical protein